MPSSTTNFCRSCKRLEGVIQMKVLFAVNSESISEAIIKKYQKDYREILSYKNVYYFNAIQKEIQRDKSYDRIVISADLEPFSNNNYESIDKFIFEKLDGISDEAHDTTGNEISIILICSDRHTKGSSFLVKLFGLGIYNGLLGNDRSMEEVCRLIHKPRTKKEAKMYYKIDTDDVNYRAENENEVDELQIQNILSHFRKLGKHTEKYAESFENIASQYTEEQLKIIINCLPFNVKGILEETSNKYQEFMMANGMMVQGVKSKEFTNKEDQKRTGVKIDLIENKLNQTKVNGPIVIPNSVKSSGTENARKVIAVPQKNQNSANVQANPSVKAEVKKNPVNSQKPEATKKEGKLVRLPDGRIVRKKVVSKPANEPTNQVAQNETSQIARKGENQMEPKTVKPERRAVNLPENNQVMPNNEPEKISPLEDLDLPELDFTASAMESKISHNQPQANPVEQPKKGRGRPRKNPVDAEPKPKGKRGRPRKNPAQEEMVQPAKTAELDFPELDTAIDEQFDFEPLEDEIATNVSPKTQNNDFEDFVLEENEEFNTQEPAVAEVEEVDELEEIELPELDDLEDISDFGDDDDIFAETTEEAFDEFEEYDEYGKYETTAKQSPETQDIESLYQEDILSDESNDLLELDQTDDLADLDILADDELEDALDMDFETDDNNDDVLLSDLETEDDILADVELPEENDDTLIGFEDEEPFQQPEEDLFNPSVEENVPNNTMVDNQDNFNYGTEAIQSIEPPIDYSMSNLNSLMTKDKKIVTFLGSTKNGVSFLVNNLAEIFASVGINTAILDMTKNRNSYYIYTQNEETLRQIAYTSIEKLQQGTAEGIRVKQNLTVYTALPNDGKNYSNVEAILSTLVQNHSLILIDCDYDTNPAYFASCQEIYLVQSMDILTIQPLTAFLRDLKTQGVFEPEKVRVVINKELKVRGLTNKAIIGGMSSYNDPAMSFMTELFDKESVKYCSIPFEEMAYSKYLEGMLNCKVSISGYSKNFMNKLRVLGDMVYPLTSRATYSSNSKQNYTPNNFSSSMNDTLNKMKKKY